MQLATWNVNSLTVRLPQVLDWLAANPVDALVLQETKTTDDKFPKEAIEAAGYKVAFFGQKTYNGVALLSRSDATEVVKNIPGFEDDMARVIAGTVDGVRVIGAYFPNGQAPDSDKFVYKMRWLEALNQWVREELKQHPKLVLMGDFNITVDDRDVWDPIGLKDTIHCTVAEREHFQSLIESGMHDAYRLFDQPEKTYSWWDYREFAFRRNRGLRIDHILVSETLKPSVQACVIDKAPRKNERPSDHTPVVVTLG
ncbi:exodeoxyribonuclease III [Limnohabitans sp. TS-CS-82]|jgi:exodeoxyribonuclease-3|uniref:exodeoxyribonuclease III n=1 Tax=Limnohabitans sp. TS-CS-82 TaxID=2094193 RepID=UPI000CF22756|nr:exodeoxyribonuclease III [Limnohabitans sp. TS-CS-82]PQA80967.1 exodeoxyribonuclease III [Limnohabitans sp. TS-CS-82]